jgi:hypothetical protein
MRKTRLASIAASIVAVLLMTHAALAHGYSAGPIRVEHPWAAATPPGAAVGAAYMRVANTGRTPMRLVGASTPAAQRVEIHTMSMEGGVMRMRPVVGGLVVPAGGQVRLAPGGLHLMLIGLKGPLRVEDFVPLSLHFEGGLNLTVELYVEDRASGHRH